MTATIQRGSHRDGVLAGMGTMVVLGGSVPVTGMLDGYPVVLGQALRYALGGLLLLGWAYWRGIRLPLPGLRDLPALVGLAASGMIGFQAFLLLAQRYAEPGLAAAVLGGSPLVLAFGGALVARRRPAAAPVLGAVLAAAGVAVLSGGGAWHGPGLLLAVLAMLAEVSFTLFAVGVIARLGPRACATWSCVVAAAGGAVTSAVLGETWRLPAGRTLVAVLVLAVVVTAIAFCAWYFAVSVLGADRAGVLLGIVPVSGLIVAVLLGAQSPQVVDVLGALLVGAGVVVGLHRSASDRRGPSGARPAPRPAAPR
ncbi:MAG: EamA family transporter [Pseudonocardiaceae bacterium]|nr:EamA family transporter [Pseudonocardiaceae bacterium]